MPFSTSSTQWHIVLLVDTTPYITRCQILSWEQLKEDWFPLLLASASLPPPHVILVCFYGLSELLHFCSVADAIGHDVIIPSLCSRVSHCLCWKAVKAQVHILHVLSIQTRRPGWCISHFWTTFLWLAWMLLQLPSKLRASITCCFSLGQSFCKWFQFHKCDTSFGSGSCQWVPARLALRLLPCFLSADASLASDPRQ